MNEHDRKLFAALNHDRKENAAVLEKASMRGVKNSVVEKYSDQAHFIYELLQNADDTGAAAADFRLFPDKLVFTHKGKRHFFITDPANEDEDTENGTLGDLNAITSVANSNKTGASIGKFGVGFKAVFQYTSTPHIYDPDFQFRIDRFIVPEELDCDYPGRNKEDTVFVFPFNHPERTAEAAYEDIADKLKKLVYPILFLNHLKDITFEIGETVGLYEKSVQEEFVFPNGITAQNLKLSRNIGDDIVDEHIWLFSRKDTYGRDYCIGFFTDENEQLKPCSMPAFCFFPTKEITNLNFILHAPFLLTDSREGIRAGEAYNTDLIVKLAMLAADSLYCLKEIGERKSMRLITDSILNIVPVNPSAFRQVDDRTAISFLPFYTHMKEALMKGLLPTADGYTSKENAYWSDTQKINRLFSDEQLSELLGQKCQWVFKSFARGNLPQIGSLRQYIDGLTAKSIDEYDVFNKINGDFIKKQDHVWLHSFYEWLGDVSARFANYLKFKPIFIEKSGEAVAAYDDKKEQILFLPTDLDMDCPTIAPEFLENEKTKEFLLNIVKLKEPSKRDYIYNKIKPQYKSNGGISTIPHFEVFFDYYCECGLDERQKLISQIRDLEFLRYTDQNGKTFRTKGSELYFPTQELKEYFQYKPDTKFINYDEYLKKTGDDEKKQDFLRKFLTDVGVGEKIRVIHRNYNSIDNPAIIYNYRIPFTDGGGTREIQIYGNDELIYIDKFYHFQKANIDKGVNWSLFALDGCREILDHITEKSSEDASFYLWKTLIEQISTGNRMTDVFRCTHTFFYHTQKTEYCLSQEGYMLQNEKWLLSKSGEFCAPSKMHYTEINDTYPTNSPEARQLMEFLGIDMSEKRQPEPEEDDHLTDEQKEDIAIGQAARNFGFTSGDELEKFLKEHTEKHTTDDKNNKVSVFTSIDTDKKDIKENSGADDPGVKEETETIATVIRDISNNARTRIQKPQKADRPISKETEEDSDIDDFNPRMIDYQKKIERKKEQSSEEIETIARMQELQETAAKAEKYSYLWFRTLLEMEILNSAEDSVNSREINISFGKIEREHGTQKTFILKQPSRYIPQYMEDLADIPMVLHLRDDSVRTVAIEVSSVKSYSLHVKLRTNAELDDVDLSAVREISIKAVKPVFLLEHLRGGLASLGLEDSCNMKQNLPANLEFIFGPPGTGKTTYLAEKVLVPLMRDTDEKRVLVLTPTNKAADVITERIMERMGDDLSYENWLVRFGNTASEEIERSPVYRDKTFDIRSLKKSITVTTIARFPYDFFMPMGERLHLAELKWDYIVVDEASMIPLVQMIYPLYKKTPEKFIIAGDPFQIGPISSVQQWEDENIYTLVRLRSFIDPVTEPIRYPVHTLLTQYRSIPEIGELFSRFMYDGKLRHSRPSASQKKLHLSALPDIRTLNIVKFPVSKYESIYRPKRLKGTTPYQVYSAIFTMEFVNYLSQQLNTNEPEETFRIGVIAPYRAQASLIDKLMASVRLPENIEVMTDTIHGFQGDECDIVLAVLNPPPGISASDRVFLNKRNILNVAISRTRDYLFVIMPDDRTEGVEELKQVKRIEHLIEENDDYSEFSSSELENIMFGTETYIEDNSFSTGHQIVNVYGKPEMKYEIRSDDNAVDVQIHRT